MNSYIIFGANSDIGSRLIEKLALNNKVYAIARNFSIHQYNNVNIEPIQSEFLDFNTVEQLINEIVKKDSNIRGVANFAGSIYLKPAHLVNEEDYIQVFDSNFKTSFAITRACGKLLSNSSILFISSTATLVGLANHELLAATKAAINGMVISAAASYTHKNLRFNAIAPALVDTKLAKVLIANETSRKISENMNPLAKIGSPSDIVNMAYFLLDPENSWITGQIIAVDGGMSHIRHRMKV